MSVVERREAAWMRVPSGGTLGVHTSTKLTEPPEEGGACASRTRAPEAAAGANAARSSARNACARDGFCSRAPCACVVRVSV